MNIKNLLALGMKGMAERRFRTALTVLSVIIGVAAIVALISLTEGVSNSISQSLDKIGPTTLFVTPGAGTIFTAADVAEISSFPNVSEVVPILRFTANITVSGKTETVTVYGVDNSSIANTIGGVSLYSGTTYNSTAGPTALIGYSVAFPNTGQTVPSLAIDEPVYLTIPERAGVSKTVTLVPVGLLNSYGTAFFISPDDSIFIPLSEAESLLNRYSYNILIVKATNTSTVAPLDSLLSNVYNNKASVLSVEQITSTISSVIGSLSLLLAGIAGISLLVAGISILSIMMVSVTERTHEIGILKSIGFRQKDVMFLFLSEALIVGFIGGILGSGLGLGGAYVLTALLSGSSGAAGAPSSAGSFQGAQAISGGGGGGAFRGGGGGGGGAVFVSSGEASRATSSSSSASSLSFTPSVSPEVIGVAILLAMIVSVFASFYPAWKASKIDPIRALRSE